MQISSECIFELPLVECHLEGDRLVDESKRSNSRHFLSGRTERGYKLKYCSLRIKIPFFLLFNQF